MSKEKSQDSINEPMGVSMWLEHGKRYGYLLFLKEGWKIKIKERIRNARDEISKYGGTHKYDSCYDDCLQIIDKEQ